MLLTYLLEKKEEITITQDMTDEFNVVPKTFWTFRFYLIILIVCNIVQTDEQSVMPCMQSFMFCLVLRSLTVHTLGVVKIAIECHLVKYH